MIHDIHPARLIPSVDAALRNLATSSWLKNALLTALERDPVQAANEAQLLFEILDAHASEVVERSLRHPHFEQAAKS